jgi:SRSO17 transposase
MNHMAEQHMMAQRKAAEEQMEAMTQAQGLAQNESRSEKDGSRNASTEENEAGLRKRK